MQWLKKYGVWVAAGFFGCVVGFLWLGYLVVLLIATNDFARPGQFGDSFGALNALFSGLAMVGVVTAIILQSFELQRVSEAADHQHIDRTLELFQQFRQDQMSSARTKAWRARTKWFKYEEYRKSQIGVVFPKTLEEMEMWEVENEEALERRAIYDMLEFYSMLAHHPGSDETVRAFGFYYASWRGFLRSFIDAYNKEYDGLGLSKVEKKQLPKAAWLEHITKLEGRLGLPEYDQAKHFFDRVFLERQPDASHVANRPGGVKDGEPS
jgi:hypothetical protein